MSKIRHKLVFADLGIGCRTRLRLLALGKARKRSAGAIESARKLRLPAHSRLLERRHERIDPARRARSAPEPHPREAYRVDRPEHRPLDDACHEPVVRQIAELRVTVDQRALLITEHAVEVDRIGGNLYPHRGRVGYPSRKGRPHEHARRSNEQHERKRIGGHARECARHGPPSVLDSLHGFHKVLLTGTEPGTLPGGAAPLHLSPAAGAPTARSYSPRPTPSR